MLPERFLPMGYSFQVFFDLGAVDGIVSQELNIGTVFSAALGAQNASQNVFDTQFQSVSGLSVSFSTEGHTEGGENSFRHELPNRATYQNLVLTRGLAPSSALTNWVHEATENHNFIPAQVAILLLGPDRNPMHAWYVNNAYPIKWSVDAFNAEESKIVIETLELQYNFFKSLNPKELNYDVMSLARNFTP